MKRLTFALALLFSVAIAHATSTAPKMDTLSVDRFGTVKRFVASWGTAANNYSATTTVDTLILPAGLIGRSVEIRNDGGATDTICVGYNQVSNPPTVYLDCAVKTGEVVLRDFGAACITRIYIKGSGTIRCRIKIIGF